MKMRKHVKKDIIKGVSILILMLIVLIILYLSEIQAMSGCVEQINYPSDIAIRDEAGNLYRIQPFGNFKDRYHVGEEVKVYYYPNTEDDSNENRLTHSIIFSK